MSDGNADYGVLHAILHLHATYPHSIKDSEHQASMLLHRIRKDFHAVAARMSDSVTTKEESTKLFQDHIHMYTCIHSSEAITSHMLVAEPAVYLARSQNQNWFFIDHDKITCGDKTIPFTEKTVAEENMIFTDAIRIDRLYKKATKRKGTQIDNANKAQHTADTHRPSAHSSTLPVVNKDSMTWHADDSLIGKYFLRGQFRCKETTDEWHSIHQAKIIAFLPESEGTISSLSGEACAVWRIQYINSSLSMSDNELKDTTQELEEWEFLADQILYKGVQFHDEEIPRKELNRYMINLITVKRRHDEDFRILLQNLEETTKKQVFEVNDSVDMKCIWESVCPRIPYDAFKDALYAEGMLKYHYFSSFI